MLIKQQFQLPSKMIIKKFKKNYNKVNKLYSFIDE